MRFGLGWGGVCLPRPPLPRGKTHSETLAVQVPRSPGLQGARPFLGTGRTQANQPPTGAPAALPERDPEAEAGGGAGSLPKSHPLLCSPLSGRSA